MLSLCLLYFNDANFVSPFLDIVLVIITILIFMFFFVKSVFESGPSEFLKISFKNMRSDVDKGVTDCYNHNVICNKFVIFDTYF